MDSSGLLLLFAAAAALAAGVVESDFQQDKTECAPQLVGLAPCLPYVGGESKAPTLDCCSGMKQVMAKSRKCICLLIKDRDEPNLGVKVNISLAANLPDSCKSPFNVSECVSLLHLKPNSTEAKKFDGLDEIIGNSSASTNGGGGAPSAAASAASGGRATVVGGGGGSNASNDGGDQTNKKRGGLLVAVVTSVGVLCGLVKGFTIF